MICSLSKANYQRPTDPEKFENQNQYTIYRQLICLSTLQLYQHSYQNRALKTDESIQINTIIDLKTRICEFFFLLEHFLNLLLLNLL